MIIRGGWLFLVCLAVEIGVSGCSDGGSPGTGEKGGGRCTQASPSGMPVALAEPTATFSQTQFGIARSIDGITDDQFGWAVLPNTVAQTASLETLTSTGVFPGGTRLAFRLTHFYSVTGDHALGRFRLSVTTADRAAFADGNDGTATPGAVGDDAIWSPLTPASACATGGVELAILSDASLLAEVNHVAPIEYVVVAETPLTGITGIRIQALEDPSLPFDGPGLQADNGNFVLTEFEMFAEAP